MKLSKLFLLFLSLSFTAILLSCDSATDSVAINVSAPSLLSPTNGDTTVTLTPTLKWTGLADKVEISTDGSITHVIHSAAVNDSSYTIPSGILQNGTWYYWHAGIYSGTGEVWSGTIYSFKTHN